MSGLIPFQFDGREIRVVTDDNGEPWFNAKEICEILDYGNSSQALSSHVDADDLQKLEVIDSMGRKQMANHVNESGLYALIFGSTKDEAKRFKRWVTHEVLPTIRRTGSYVAPGAKAPSSLESVKEFKALFGVAKLIGLDKNAAAISANQAVTHLTGTNLLSLLGQTHLEQPEQTQYFTPTELGERIKLSGRKVNMLLAEAGFQFKRGDVWEVMDSGREFAKIYDTGKKHGSGVPIQQVKWSANVLPLLEQNKAA
jgi:prophage antirepressor-like protein